AAPSAPVAVPAAPAPAQAVSRAPVFGGLIQVWQDVPQARGALSGLRIRRAELSARSEIGDGVTAQLVIDPALVLDDGVTTTPFLTSSATGKSATGLTGVKRLSILKMAFVALDRPFPQVPLVKRVQAGQFKVPFGMEG